MTVLCYIHLNPVKVCLVNKAEEYKWSSCSDDIDVKGITDIDLALDYLNTE
jgi:hypothetical protein